MAKTGRKAQHWRDCDTGKVYSGLGRRPSKNGTPGRFYAINDRNVTFGNEPKAAVARFQAHQRETRGERPMLVFGVDAAMQDIAAASSVQVSGTNGDGASALPDRETLNRILKVGDDYQRVPDELKPLIMGLQAHKGQWPQYAEERGLDPELPFESYWPDYIYWLIGRWIKTEPVDAAQKLGIPELKNLGAIKQPPKSLTLSELAGMYADKISVSGAVKRRTATLFGQFAKIVNAGTVKQIEATDIETYRRKVLTEYESKRRQPCWVVHRFGTVKTVFAHALKQGRDQEELGRVLVLLKMLEAPKNLSGATANPISRDDFQAVLRVADVRETSIALMGLNCAFYPIDICRVPVSAVDLGKGQVFFPRTKVGKPIPRVAILWRRTIAAIEDYRDRHAHGATGDHGEKLLFANKKRKPMNKQAIAEWWRGLSTASRVKTVFSQLRDGAYTACVEAGIDITQAEILMGHSVGASKDAYIGRRPEIVADACAAIEKYYFD